MVQRLSEKNKRVLVVGFYLVASAKTIHQWGISSTRFGGVYPAENSETPKSPYEGLDVRFSERGIIDHPEMPNWVLQCAVEAIP
jgi:hypothetical protein